MLLHAHMHSLSNRCAHSPLITCPRTKIRTALRSNDMIIYFVCIDQIGLDKPKSPADKNHSF